MAWTTPQTYAVGHDLLAADLNTYQRDNLNYLYDRLAGASGTPASLPVTMTTKLTYYSGSELTLAAGTWLLFGAISYKPAAGDDRMRTRIRRITATAATEGEIEHSAVLATGSNNRAWCALNVVVTPAGTVTYQLQGTNVDSNGGTITAALFSAIRVAT